MKQYSDLTDKQLDCVDFILEDDYSLVLADVGTGKTVISLTAVKEWLANGGVRRVLVVGPMRVARDVWKQEKEEWTHLKDEPFRIEVAADVTETKRRKIIEGDAEIFTINYESLPWLFYNYPDLEALGFDALICDEIDKMKSHTSNRFKGFKKKLKDKTIVKVPGLRRIRAQFSKIVGLTGTPTPKNLLDLWAEAFIVDGGQHLGKSYDKFRRKYFFPTDYRGYSWEPFNETAVYDAIAPLTYRIERDSQIPDLRVIDRWVELPNKVYSLYAELEKEFIIALETDKRTKKTVRPANETEDKNFVTELEAANAGVLAGKLRQVIGGFLYLDDAKDAKGSARVAEELHTEKLKDLDNLISELQGQQLLVVYHFTEEYNALREKYPYIGDARNSDDVDRWNRGELPLMGLHPKSAGHGLNMQKSSARHIAFYTLPDTAGLFEQVTGRLRRTGNDSDTIFAHRILAKHTLDLERVEVVEGRIRNATNFLKAMKARQKERTK